MGTLNLAGYEVVLSLPEHWGNKEGDAACAALQRIGLAAKLAATVKVAMEGHPEFQGVTIQVNHDE